MTIRPGEEWGERHRRPAGVVVAHSDAELASLAGVDDPLSVDGGDLHRFLGSPPSRSDAQRLGLDLLDVAVDGRRRLAVAHVIARRSWWRGPLVAVCNVGLVGEWNVAPRSHPNDGRLDIVEVSASMSMRDRWKARRRVVSGTHVPHPAISTSSSRTAVWEFERPLRVWIDGVPSGRCASLEVTIRPDSLVVYC